MVKEIHIEEAMPESRLASSMGTGWGKKKRITEARPEKSMPRRMKILCFLQAIRADAKGKAGHQLGEAIGSDDGACKGGADAKAQQIGRQKGVVDVLRKPEQKGRGAHEGALAQQGFVHERPKPPNRRTASLREAALVYLAVCWLTG